MQQLSTTQIAAVSVEIKRVIQETILPVYDSGDPISSWDKGNSQRDITTKTDQLAEERLTRFLQKLVPGSVVIGEEDIGTDQAKLKRLIEAHRTQGVVWTVDPIDGTANFTKRGKGFGTMISCVIDGRTQHAWILCPLIGSGILLTATCGKGARLQYGALDETNIKMRPLIATQPVFQQIKLGYYALRRDFSYDEGTAISMQQKIKPHEGGLYAHSSMASETCAIATNGNLGLIYSHIKPWDCLPPALILREARGVLAPANDLDRDEMFGYDEAEVVIIAPTRTFAQKIKYML